MKLPWLFLTPSLMFAEPLADPARWSQAERDAALTFFETEVYGKVPAFGVKSGWLLDRESLILEGQVIRREYVLSLNESVSARVLVHLPKGNKSSPVFLGLNFGGNHTTSADDWITAGNDRKRGQAASRWPVKLVTGSGFGLVTVHCDDFDPDQDDGFKNGVHALSADRRNPASWGTIAGWAWGLEQVTKQAGIGA